MIVLEIKKYGVKDERVFAIIQIARKRDFRVRIPTKHRTSF